MARVPAARATATAASTFWRLCSPKSGISEIGQHRRRHAALDGDNVSPDGVAPSVIPGWRPNSCTRQLATLAISRVTGSSNPSYSVIEREANEAALRLRVGVEVAMAIEVIGGHVEHAGDRAPWLAHRFDLERRELEDHPVGVDDAVEAIEHGHPDIPAEMDSLACALEDRRDQCGRGRLAVGPGDAADASSASFEDEVHLAAHGNAVRTGDLELGSVPRHARARADHERVDSRRRPGIRRDGLRRYSAARRHAPESPGCRNDQRG